MAFKLPQNARESDIFTGPDIGVVGRVDSFFLEIKESGAASVLFYGARTWRGTTAGDTCPAPVPGCIPQHFKQMLCGKEEWPVDTDNLYGPIMIPLLSLMARGFMRLTAVVSDLSIAGEEYAIRLNDFRCQVLKRLGADERYIDECRNNFRIAGGNRKVRRLPLFEKTSETIPMSTAVRKNRESRNVLVAPRVSP